MPVDDSIKEFKDGSERNNGCVRVRIQIAVDGIKTLISAFNPAIYVELCLPRVLLPPDAICPDKCLLMTALKNLKTGANGIMAASG